MNDIYPWVLDYLLLRIFSWAVVLLAKNGFRHGSLFVLIILQLMFLPVMANSWRLIPACRFISCSMQHTWPCLWAPPISCFKSSNSISIRTLLNAAPIAPAQKDSHPYAMQQLGLASPCLFPSVLNKAYASHFGPVNPTRNVLPLPPLRAMDRRLCAFESSLVMRSSEGYLVPPFALDSIGEGHNRGVGRSDGKSVSGGSMEGRKEGKEGPHVPHHTPSSVLPISESELLSPGCQPSRWRWQTLASSCGWVRGGVEAVKIQNSARYIYVMMLSIRLREGNKMPFIIQRLCLVDRLLLSSIDRTPDVLLSWLRQKSARVLNVATSCFLRHSP